MHTHTMHVPTDPNAANRTNPFDTCARCGERIGYGVTDRDDTEAWRTMVITDDNGHGTWCDAVPETDAGANPDTVWDTHTSGTAVQFRTLATTHGGWSEWAPATVVGYLVSMHAYRIRTADGTETMVPANGLGIRRAETKNALQASAETARAMDRESGQIDNDVAGIIGMAIVFGGLATWFLSGIIPALLTR